MKKYEVVVAGIVIGCYENETEAKARLEEAKNSFLAIHPVDVFFIREKN